ncbi:ATP-grasp domain-containing protein [Psychromicrobium lacuslunae]|uniref:Phosphoribosylglycinamide synthetase n=1 Tax=Psychromicrobium lacuslunae TaxID=1618207 RepID=A0A0D4C1I9_9MICC|nr:ATP-grasp domain-containing protein [Psychromicrobium lacuslunae]AJT42522.1 phosphoribosylglycinamide synthetase [Psychromicrobium lacuslunae]
MIPERTVGVLVDAYSTGNYLPPVFDELGIDLVHVFSTPEPMTTMLQPNPDGYCKMLAMGRDDVVAELQALQPSFVIAGQEPGVPLADWLSETLNLRTNGSALSSARRNKFEMIETVGAAGLKVAKQSLANSAEAAADWARTNAHWPCVVKPISSASTDGVVVCRSEAEVLSAARRILGKRDIFDELNDQVLVQTYLAGTEYIVDTVSCDGQARVVGIWRYEKFLLDDGSPIYNRDVLVAPSDPICDSLREYVTRVLDALGIQNGPAHAEIIVEADGPALVEIGGRLNGNMHPALHDICLGTDQAKLTAQLYASSKDFTDNYLKQPYTVRQPAVVYNAPTSHSGTVVSIDDELVSRIRDFPSVVDLTVKKKPGDVIRPTTDLLSSPLRFFMTHEDEAQLENDYHKIEQIHEEIYVVS